MKNDASRNTFDARKHYSGVRMQQGRVQLDADWNEQGDIIAHRAETEASDVIGPSGGPLAGAAFQIVTDASKLTSDEKKLYKAVLDNSKSADFLIGAGRYYVDGILCENEEPTSYADQKDLPDAPPISDAGLYLVYLDVWQRHLTALDDPGIREVALGGPDTATRTRTVWQVKHVNLKVDEKRADEKKAIVNCPTAPLTEYDKLTAASNGMLSARAQKEKDSADPCIVPPGAGYRGLENQLYRVEIHEGGAALKVQAGDGSQATMVPNRSDQITVKDGSWSVGQTVEIFSGSDPMKGTLARIVPDPDTASAVAAKPKARKAAPRTGAAGKTLTLDINVSRLAFDDLNVRAVGATYKWSRDNGAVVTAITNFSKDDPEITVHDLGPDDALGFREGQWVEVSDDGLELNGLPGQLAQIVKVDSALNLITLNVKPNPLTRNPKLRRWDGVGAAKYLSDSAGDHYLDLESGVQVRFSDGSLKTGDYWNIPARTATADTQSGNIEWPQDAKGPAALPPFGIRHHYCRLALLRWDGSKFAEPEDCRNLFPSVTALTSLFYVSGDGQEAMPGDPLPQPLQVSVFNGGVPVAGAPVRFTAQDAEGLLAKTPGGLGSEKNPLIVATDANGVASCFWKLNPKGGKSQQVEARLLDTNPINLSLLDPNIQPLPPVVRFNGNLSIASQVAYDPGQCGSLQNQTNVQDALSRLSQLTSLYKVSGDGQEVMPGDTITLKVLVANSCGAITDQEFQVTFSVVKPHQGKFKGVVRAEDGTDADSVSVKVGADGLWTCLWTPDPATPFQEVEATIKGDGTIPPMVVRFSANVSLASHVAYDPAGCGTLQNQTNVQDALRGLSQLASIYKVSGDGQEVMPGDVITLNALVANRCGPLPDRPDQRGRRVIVTFKAAANGTVSNDNGKTFTNSVDVATDNDGIAACLWKPDTAVPFQEAVATIRTAPYPTTPPASVRFSVNVSLASHVAYSHDTECATLRGRDTVQEAIDKLSQLVSLYEVSGNDQVVMPDTALAQLKVLAANACGPVGGQAVRFEVAAGSGNVSPAQVTTGADGIATVTWTLDPSMPIQQVKASLVDNSPPSVTPPTSVLFTAHLSVAGNVAYTPDSEQCPDLARAKVTNVKEALDALCKRAAGAEPGIGINGIVTVSDGRELRNDTLVMVTRLSNGIRISCDAPLLPESFGPPPDPPPDFPDSVPGKPTCFLTLDLPYPLGSEGSVWNFPDVFGFRSLIVAGSVLVDGKIISWTPTSSAGTWMQQVLFRTLMENGRVDRVLAHLTLKGNFIWSQDADTKARVYLDGDAFGTVSSVGRTDLILPTGDGRKGGDFEMWFWLMRPGLFLIAQSLTQSTVEGSVSDTAGEPLKNVKVTLTSSTGAITNFGFTGEDGRFTFIQPKAGTYQVKASFGSLTAQTTVTIGNLLR